MKRDDLDKVQWACDDVRKRCEELHALLLDTNPDMAEKFQKVSVYAGKVATCIRVNGQVPAERPKHKLVEVAKNVIEISKAVNKMSKNIPRERT